MRLQRKQLGVQFSRPGAQNGNPGSKGKLQTQKENTVFCRIGLIVNCLILSLCLVTGATLSAWTQGAAQTAPIEDFDQQIGPFELKGQRFTVVLHMKRAQGKEPVV